MDSEFKDTETVLSLPAFSKVVLAYADPTASLLICLLSTPFFFILAQKLVWLCSELHWGTYQTCCLLTMFVPQSSLYATGCQHKGVASSSWILQPVTLSSTAILSLSWDGWSTLQSFTKSTSQCSCKLMGEKVFFTGTAKQKQSTQLTNYTGQITLPE